SLDSINYISPLSFPAVLKRLHLFIRPGGLFIFDIRSEKWLKQLDGGTFVDEKDDLLCLWRADFDNEKDLLRYGINIFSRKGRLWERQEEEHTEYVYRPVETEQMLRDADFTLLKIDTEGPQGNIGREFYICRRNF
ncbi:MAG: class I SAM-dependent methyltransferase, partial [Oscillospiraceae bacterium]|nr:class I SAM-dependent methyltransferase [Oscillospiraceae bacterium]